MRMSKSSRWIPVSIAAACFSFGATQRAHAFGGFWSSSSASLKQSAEQILFVDNPDSSVTAIVRIEYEGPAQKFAWLIPVPGTPRVSVSSNIAFERLDAVTAPEYLIEVGVDSACMDVGDAAVALDGGYAPDPGPSVVDSSMPVAVLGAGSVGPYDYVDITVDSSLSDPVSVATDWLTNNGYDLTDTDSQLLSPYLHDGFNLLAFRLNAESGSDAIRPVSITYDSKQLVIPIRPTALAARDDMGIQVWVIGPAQAVPTNYASLVIDDAMFDWSSGHRYPVGTLPAGGAGPSRPYASRPSNYDAVVTAAANEAGGHGFVTELGAPASLYRDAVWSSADDQTFATLSNQSYADGIDAILAAFGEYGAWDGWNAAVEAATTLPKDVTIEAFGSHPEQYRGIAKVDTNQFFRQLHDNVIQPVSDAAALLDNGPYLTRLYTTMSADEMTIDPQFDFNPDLAQLSNIHSAEQFSCGASSWRIELPQGGVVTGDGTDWPVAVGSIPANLEVVMLSTGGSGTVVKDNRAEIGAALSKGAPETGDGSTLPPVLNGLSIGGSQTVMTPVQTDSTSHPKSPGDKCSATNVGRNEGSASALGFALAGIMLGRRRRSQPLAAGK